MEIYNLFPGSFGSNCYLLVSGDQAAVVDPSADADVILQKAYEKGATLRYILLTHAHFDHICSLDTLREKAGIPAYVHTLDAELTEDAHKNAFFTFFHSYRTWRRPEELLNDGDTLSLGETTIRVLHTPGHTNGSVCFDCGGEFLITGDTLFAQGFGRYDLYGGDPYLLKDSLQKLTKLPKSTTIYPGHGSSASLAEALDSCIYFL